MIAVLFISLVVALVIGCPIGLSLGISVLCTFLYNGDFNLLVAIPQKMFTQIDSTSLMAVPFFILAGNLMERGGISKRLVMFIQTLVGRQPASLANITTVSSAFFGAISGSNPATVAAIGGVMSPELKKQGYPDDISGAIAAASGTLGVVIPPSIAMVVYCLVSGTSVGKMFMAGVVPGILLCIAICSVNVFTCRKYQPGGQGQRPTLRDIGKSFLTAVWALIMPVIILGGIYGGFCTPTEAAAIACVYSWIVSMFVFKELTWKDLFEVLKKSSQSAAIVMIVIGFSGAFSWCLTTKGITVALTNAVLTTFTSKIALLLMINVVLLLLGLILETTAIILLVTNILLPIAVSIGYDPIALGILMVVNTSIGMITPPMAVNLFVASSVTKARIESISKRIVPYLLAELVVLLLITYIPQITLWLPNLGG